MKKTVFAFLAVALVAFVAVAGCVTTPAEEPSLSPVGVWVSSDGFVLSLSTDGVVFVFAENTYRGTYELTEQGIRIDIDDSTKMAAPQKEATFITILDFVTEYSFENSELILTAEGEEPLTFQRSLVGTWETKNGFTLTFNKDKTFGARAVNGLAGTYAFTEDGIEFTLGFQTLVAGSEEDMKAEDEFFDALKAATDFTVIGNKLTLLDAEGKELLTLTGEPVGKWMTGNCTLELSREGTVVIVAGNTYKGTYEFENHAITLKDLEPITKMTPSEEEKEFMSKLESAGYTLKVSQFLTAYSMTSADKPLKAVLVFSYA